MRATLIARALFALALFAPALFAPDQARAATPVERHGSLRVEGNRIVGSHGRPVTLRGASLFWSQWMPRFYDPRTVRWLARDWRVDLVRAAVAVHQDGYLAHPTREWAKLETVVDAAVAERLYVIVDWHAHEPEPEAAAAFFDRVARRWGHLSTSRTTSRFPLTAGPPCSSPTTSASPPRSAAKIPTT